MARTLPILSSCAHVAEHTPYVSLNHAALDSAAEEISEFLKDTSFDLGSWVLEPLHPDPKTCPFNFFDWIFFVSALNFSFWSESDQEHRFGIEWKRGLDGKGGSGTIIHSGYASLLAGIGRALEEGVPITTPSYYANMTQAQLQHVFRSARQETMPLLEQRLDVLHQVGRALLQRWQGSFENVVRAAGGSAVALVQLMVQEFPPFDDASQYQGQTVYLYKRAQICVAETWAALEGRPPADFSDIDQLTAFADYRVPQILESIGALRYSSELREALLEGRDLPNGADMEVSIRALTLLAVEELRQKLTSLKLNAIQLDFALWTLAKRREFQADLPHHKTRSIYY